MVNTFRRSQGSRVVTRAPREIIGGLLLDIGGPIEFPPVEHFKTSEWFAFGARGDVGGRLPISPSSDKFASVFFDLIEENVSASTLKPRRLLQCSDEESILSVLGGRNRAQIHLAHLHMFLRLRADKTDVFLCYVANQRGVIWSVDVSYNFGRQAWDIDPVLAKSAVMLDVHRVLSPAEL